MKRFGQALAVIAVTFFITQTVFAHDLYLKENPTNDNGIEFGVNNANSFTRWRAYVKGATNNTQGANTGWKDSGNGWWYYDLTSVSQRVMWRLDGLANQDFVITYWVYKADNSWEFGPQVTVKSDQIFPNAWYTELGLTQNLITVKVASSDNLGVSELRVYITTPGSNCILPGWQLSDLPNQYFLGYSAATLNQVITAPCSGQYTITLWVKDISGNISYEPGGPKVVDVSLTTPDPTPVVPLAPSDLVVTETANNLKISWKDNANNEDGYYLYRNSLKIATLSANAISYDDLNLPYGDNYCYRVVAYKGLATSQTNTTCLYLEQPVQTDYRYATDFIYPMKCDKIYRFESDEQIPVGACFDYQPFGSLFSVAYKVHLGGDLNLKSTNDLGAPLFAIGNALVWDVGWTSGWGNYLILQIKSAPGNYFYLSDGNKVTEIYCLYAHLDQIKIIKDDGQVILSTAIVEKQTYVRLGWQVGTVGTGNNNYSPHLHFEIRFNGYDQLGPGYWPIGDFSYLKSFVDPWEFIENNSQGLKRPFTLYIHGYDHDTTRKAYISGVLNTWSVRSRVYDGLPLSSIGWSNHLWLTSSANNFTASWNFQVPWSGSWSVYAIIPRYYAEADKAVYNIWHSLANFQNPRPVVINQANNNVNQKAYLGTFTYFDSQTYKVELNGYNSANIKNVAFDTLLLVFEDDLGTGGGDDDPPQTNDGNTVYSDGTLTFKYSGTYTRPELHCQGAGLVWQNIIFNNGLKEKTVAISQSESVFCNILFEDGTWWADWLGLKADQHLSAAGLDLQKWISNNQGGGNVSFYLDLENPPPDDPPDDPPPVDPPDDPPIDPPPVDPGDGDSTDFEGTLHVDFSGNGKVFGCQMQTMTMNSGTLYLNYLLMIWPGLLIGLRQLIKKTK